MYVSDEMVRKAKKACLYDFMIENYGYASNEKWIKIEMDDGIVLCCKGWTGYTVKNRLGDEEGHGNAIDFLMEYEGLTFQEAVIALQEYCQN